MHASVAHPNPLQLGSRRASVIFLPALMFFLLAVVTALPAHGQRGNAAANVTVRGQIIDAESGRGLPGALVQIEALDRSTFADSDGRFRLERIPPDEYSVSVQQIGYETAVKSWTISEGMPALRIELAPQPLVLEKIRVQADRFKRQRNGAAVSVRTFDRADLVGSSARDAVDFVRLRGSLIVRSCPGWMANAAPASGYQCAYVRGRFTPVTVYIDERPAFGLDELSMYRPEELFLVEMYAGGRHIRAYTTWWVERVAKEGGRTLQPFIF